MFAGGHRSRWVVGGIGVLLVVSACTDSTPTTGEASSTATASDSPGPLACDSIDVRDTEIVLGKWVPAEQVLVRAPEGTALTVTLPADAPAGIATGMSLKQGNLETRTEGLTVQQASVTTSPASDLDPAKVLEAIGSIDGEALWLTNLGVGSAELSAELGATGTVVFRGAQEATANFAGDCSDPSGDTVPITGSARYFTDLQAGVLDCSEPAQPSVRTDPGTLADDAAEYCLTE